MKKYMPYILALVLLIIMYLRLPWIERYPLLPYGIAAIFGLWGLLLLRKKNFLTAAEYLTIDVLVCLYYAVPFDDYDKICPWVSIHLCFAGWVLIVAIIKMRIARRI